MTFIVKLGERLLKNCVFSLQKPLFPYPIFVAPFICNTTLFYMVVVLGCFYLGFLIGKFGTNLQKYIMSHLSRLHYTLGCCMCDSDMKMHYIYLYLRNTDSYVLFSDRRNVVRLHTANPVFP